MKQGFIHLTDEGIVKLVIPFMLLALSIPGFSQEKKKTISSGGTPSLSLRGRIDSFEINQESSSSDFLSVKLTMELVNTGKSPIILLNASPSSSGGLKTEPYFVGAGLTKNVEGEYLTKTYVGPALDLSPKWMALRTSLNQTTPPPDKVRILMPNEIMNLEASIGLDLPKKPENFAPFKKASLNQILNSSPVWLKVVCEVWPLNLEPEVGKKKLQMGFGHQLQRRWKNLGHLWLDEIYSEPILLDLKSKAK